MEIPLHSVPYSHGQKFLSAQIADFFFELQINFVRCRKSRRSQSLHPRPSVSDYGKI
ncbi:hypothetical protein [Pseudanabaena sp. lw0831]|uniref:hypothetical protein n=1 Tax=Pseudanabaena sp. lw0831 TaxID=1357935 RepID=UPI001915F9DD|nr:hypothetical protein [Pseudanabaena sp. lw0831]